MSENPEIFLSCVNKKFRLSMDEILQRQTTLCQNALAPYYAFKMHLVSFFLASMLDTCLLLLLRVLQERQIATSTCRCN